jgi:septal ring factor EnvC (AmiA/AmiB activator)
MLAVLRSLIGNGVVVALAEILAIALLPVILFLVGRLFAAEAKLAQARERVVDALAEVDQVRAELALARDRLAQTRQAAGRAQAETAERELRLQALLAAAPRIGEGRCDAVSRKVAEALREDRHWIAEDEAPPR